jgi:hypothetical protein
MKLSPAQQKAFNRITAEGEVRDGQGIAEATIDALARQNLISVERTTSSKRIARRGAGVRSQTVRHWVARPTCN